MQARSVQVGPQPSAPSDHLPELRLGTHQLEEHQVDHLGHVDSGVEHIDRDRDVRCLVGVEKSSVRLCAYGVPWMMTRAKCPAY